MATHKPTLLLLSLILLFISTHGQLLPIVGNQGGIPGQTQTYIVHVAKPNDTDLLSDDDLASHHLSLLPNTTLDTGAPRLVYSYRHAMSGFAARLTPEEAAALKSIPGFRYAHPDKLHHLATTYTPQYLGLTDYSGDGAWAGTMFGEGIVIGVIDTGVFPTHPSFGTDGIPPPPLKWKGNCTGSGIRCTRKIIGAKGFYNGKNPAVTDDDGHGTHVASTAAGNFVDGARVTKRLAPGTASGMAPKAHLAIYKVCFADGCWGSDTYAAIDQAIKDGVDILSMSISGDPNGTLYEDAVALGSMAAVKNGISPCTAAGNDGPRASTLSHSAPWVTTVGASSTDRRNAALVKLGNGEELHGESGYHPWSFNSSESLSIAFPGEQGDTNAYYCLDGSLDFIDVVGKLVVCSAGGSNDVDKGKVVYAAGGAAMIIMNDRSQANTTFSEAHVLPAAQLSYLDGRKLLDYLYFGNTSTPVASITFHATQFGFRPSPTVASFSSRGPSKQNGGILKPDVLAPGVNILAAWPTAVGPRPNPFATKTFNFESGTSMATPHVSGIMALIKNKNPTWSPAAIHSALVTSAKAVDVDGNAISDDATGASADANTMGAGQVNPAGALDPGLVFEVTSDDYTSYLCGLGYTDDQVSTIVGEQVTCTTAVEGGLKCPKFKPVEASQLNGPSIAVSFDTSSGSSVDAAPKMQTVTRTVIKVGGPQDLFVPNIQEPGGVEIFLSTYELRFDRVGQEKSFNVTFVMPKSRLGRGQTTTGKLEWVSNYHVVKIPLAVTFN